MGKIGRSFSLLGSSLGVLRRDPELAVLMLISGAVTLAVSLAFVLGFGIIGVLEGGARDAATQIALPGILTYIVGYTIAFYFQSAVVAGALERMGGGDPTVGSSLAAATRRIGPIVIWGVIAGTVGWLISVIQERSGPIGSIIAGVIGFAWSLATFFMVPILVNEQLGIGGSLGRSWDLFKKTWGETVVSGIAMGLLILLGILVLAALVIGLAAANLVIAAVAVAVIGAVVLLVATSTLQAIYVAALYRYAATGEVAVGFDQAALAGAFSAKPR